ncbi:hypothetical protein KEM55_004482, partial [Ascosphaera atra]
MLATQKPPSVEGSYYSTASTSTHSHQPSSSYLSSTAGNGNSYGYQPRPRPRPRPQSQLQAPQTSRRQSLSRPGSIYRPFSRLSMVAHGSSARENQRPQQKLLVDNLPDLE